MNESIRCTGQGRSVDRAVKRLATIDCCLLRKPILETPQHVSFYFLKHLYFQTGKIQVAVFAALTREQPLSLQFLLVGDPMIAGQGLILRVVGSTVSLRFAIADNQMQHSLVLGEGLQLLSREVASLFQVIVDCCYFET